MKKTVAILLAVLMVISNLICAFTVSAETATSDSVGEYFENPENWTLDKESATAIGSTTQSTWAYVKNSSVTVGGNTANAIRLNALNHRASIYLPNLKKNTEYTFSFKYYAESKNVTGSYAPDGCIFKDMVLFTPDYEGAKIAWNTTTPNGVKEFVSYNGYYIWNDDYSKSTANGEGSYKTIAAKAGEWNTYTLTFNTGDYDNYATVLLPKVETVYLDDFALAEKIITPEEHFNNPENWTLDTESATAIGSTTPSTWASISNSTVTVGGNTVNAIKLFSQNNRSSVYLPNLKKNTEYTFSFKYYSESENTSGVYGPEGCIFKDMVLFTPDYEGAKIAWNTTTPNGVKEYVSYNGYYIWNEDYSILTDRYDVNSTTKAAKAGEWNTYSVTFNTGDYENYATVLLPKVQTVYLCDFALAEKVITPEEHFNNPKNWMLFGESVKTLDTPLTSTWATISNAPVTVGSATTANALKFFALNHRVASYLPNLKKNTEYTFSFKFYAETKNTSGYIFQDMVLFTPDYPNAQIAWSTGAANGVKEFVSYNGYYLWNDDYSKAATNWDDGKKTISAKAGVWNTHTVTFNTGDYENYAIVLLAKVENIYLKDFKLFDTSNPPEEPEEPEEQVPLNFEDVSQWERYAYNATNTTTGQSTNSWHVISENISKTEFIKDGYTSIKITPQAQFNMIKLGDLEPNTKYMLKFSYITDSMKNSDGSERKTVLSSCGIWNYKYSGAKFSVSHVENRGYLHASKMSGDYFEIYFNALGERTIDYFARKVTNQQAGVWYDKALYFNSADVSDSLAFVVSLDVANVYFDNFELVALDESEEEAEYTAPTLSGKTPTGKYESYKTNTTLYNDVTSADYEGYLNTLKTSDFSEYATNAYGDNEFAIYTKGNVTLNVTYNPYNSTMLVAEQVTNTLPTLAKDNVYTDKGYKPAFIQIDHDTSTNGGMGMVYAVRLADGSFIVVDGGMPAYGNADRLYNALKEYSSEEKPVIAAWLITHGHEDHIGGLTTFVEKYYDKAVIEQVIFSFPTMEQCVLSKSPYDHAMTCGSIAPMFLSLQVLMPNTKISTCHSGYKYNIRNAVVDVMFTLEDLFPIVFGSSYNDHNGICTLYKISFVDEGVDQTMLLTGDINGTQAEKVMEKYPNDELKATFVQAVHHGISFGGPIDELYSKIQPEVVLLPSTSDTVVSYLNQKQNQYLVNTDSVKEIVISDYATRAFVLPYAVPEGLKGIAKFTIPSNLDAVDTLNTYVGVSIRQAGENADAKQALRFKFQIPEHVIRAQTEDGYTVAEYGMMVSENNVNLNYYEGNKAYIKVDGTKVFKGVAYNKADNKNVVFDYVNYTGLDDGVSRSTQYTCALYNIGVGKDGTTDYTKYDTTYYVRSYIVFKNANGDSKVYYGETQSASVFAVMQTILKSTATDAQTTSDKAYVKNFLDGKTSGFEADATAIKEAWIKDSTRASLYTPAN